MLEIAVEHDHGVATRVIDAGKQRHLMAKPRGKGQHAHPRVPRGDARKELERAVGTAIDDVDDLGVEAPVKVVDDPHELRVKIQNHLFLVVDGAEDAEGLATGRDHSGRNSARRASKMSLAM